MKFGIIANKKSSAKEVKEINAEITGMSLIFAEKENANTAIYFNEMAVNKLNFAEGSTVAFSTNEETGEIYVTKVDGMPADGKTYLEIADMKGYVGKRVYNKRYAKAIMKAMNLPKDLIQADFELVYDHTEDGYELYSIVFVGGSTKTVETNVITDILKHEELGNTQPIETIGDGTDHILTNSDNQDMSMNTWSDNHSFAGVAQNLQEETTTSTNEA
jgi:hypothetical protein